MEALGLGPIQTKCSIVGFLWVQMELISLHFGNTPILATLRYILKHLKAFKQAHVELPALCMNYYRATLQEKKN